MTDTIPAFSAFDAADRAAIKRKIVQHLHRSGMAKALDEQDHEGHRNIIVAFEDETVGEVLEKASWSGGSANLVVLMENDYRAAVMSLVPGIQATLYAKTRANRLDLQLSSHVGMLVHAAERAREPLQLAFGSAPDSKFLKPEFVSMDELVPA